MGDSTASKDGYFAGFTYRTWLVVVINAFLGQVRTSSTHVGLLNVSLGSAAVSSHESDTTLCCGRCGWCQVVSRVMKYADNITKVFASSSGVVITMILSAYFFEFSMTLLFNLGTGTSFLSLARARS